MKFARVFTVAALLCFTTHVMCIPEMWADPVALAEPDAGAVPDVTPGCLDHPNMLYGTHALGKLLRNDTETTVKISLAGKPVASTLCPGEKYTVEVGFPLPRMMLLSTSVGSLPASDNPKWDGKCKGIRQMFGVEAAAAFTTTLDIPCTAAGQTGELWITSSMGTLDGFHQVSATMTVAADGCTKCGTGGTPGGTPSLTPPPAASESGAKVNVLDSCPEMKVKESKCTKSSLGYGCAVTAGNITVHVSYGSCVPSNPCTLAATLSAAPVTSNAKDTSTAASTAQAELLHFAMEAPSAGYLSLGPGQQANQMAKTDAVVAYITDSGRAYFETYWMEGLDMPQSAKYAQSAGMVSYAGVVAPSGGKTIICFARPLQVPAAKYTANISLSKLNLNWAVGDEDVLIKHNYCGGMVLRFEEAAAAKTPPTAPSSSSSSSSGVVDITPLKIWVTTLLLSTAAVFLL